MIGNLLDKKKRRQVFGQSSVQLFQAAVNKVRITHMVASMITNDR